MATPTMKRLVQKLQGERVVDYDTAASLAGCDVRTWFFDCERYDVDFADDFHSEGWAQFDTDQDAAYFGVWVNSRAFQVLTYAEGDWTLTECHDRTRYRGEVQRLIEFYRPGVIATAIDATTGEVTAYRQNRDEFLSE